MNEKLIALRGERSQEEVAKALGISVSALSMYEQGNRIPRDEVKIRMAEYYGISIEALFLILFPTNREEEVRT
jgi:transcriptional regulator with XRE-family HTH domain